MDWKSRLLGYTSLPENLDKKVLGKHTLILGKTGSGKSERMKMLFDEIQKKQKKASLVLLDPHGQLSQQCLAYKSQGKSRKSQEQNRLIYIDPTWDNQFIPCINPFRVPTKNLHQAQLMAQERTYAFLQMIDNSSLSLQMKTLLEPCLTALFMNEKQELSTLQKRMKAEQGDPYFELLTDKLPPNLQQFLREGFFDKRYDISKTSIYTKIQSIQNQDILYQMLK